jgi:tetratricopeptide (TPR) repeat protein
MSRASFLALICVLPLATATLAQHEHHGDEDSVGWVPREILRRPVSLRAGIGKINDLVTTSSPEAQAFYNQGIAYLHSYVWIEAARSCNQALRSDPKLALAYICLSRAYSGLEDQTAAQSALENAQSLAANLSERERLRVSLRAKQLEAIRDVLNGTKHQAYKAAIDAALAKYPEDPELWLLRGNAEEPTAAGRGQRGLVGAVAYYQAVLAISPDNPAAEHYLVHTFESIGHPEEAVKHGEIYARLCPSVPHAQHMYGHDLRILGRSDEAIAQFRKADALELSYYESEKIPARYDWHRIHNLDLMAGSYEFKGQVKQAEELLREFFSLPANDGLWASYQGDWPRFLLSRGRYAEALSAAGEMTQGKFPLQRAMGHLFAGRALVALNRANEAQQELARAEKEIENVPESDPEPLMPRPRRVLDGQRNILRGEIALRKGNTAEANAQLNEVMNRFAAVKGSGDGVNYLFTMLYIAQQARSVDDWDLAEIAAKQMLSFDPSYAGGHYVTAVVAEHKGDSATARKELAAAERLWGQADPELSEVLDIHKKLAGMRQAAGRR